MCIRDRSKKTLSNYLSGSLWALFGPQNILVRAIRGLCVSHTCELAGFRCRSIHMAYELFRGMLHERLALNTHKSLKERKFSMAIQQFHV